MTVKKMGGDQPDPLGAGSMAELVDALEERTMTWPEKWRANYVAEGRAEERLQMGHDMVSSLQKAVQARFGESAAQTFGREVEVARQGDAARDFGIRFMSASAERDC